MKLTRWQRLRLAVITPLSKAAQWVYGRLGGDNSLAAAVWWSFVGESLDSMNVDLWALQGKKP